MDKPKILYGLAFSDKQGNSIVNEEINITFYVDAHLEKKIQERYEYWKEFTGMDLVIAEDSADVMHEVEVGKVLRLVAAYKKVPFKMIRDKSSKRVAVEVRRQTMMICFGRNMSNGTISRAMHIKHDMVTYHMNEFNKLASSDKKYKEDFKAVEEYVLSELYCEYLDDGSGTKIDKP